MKCWANRKGDGGGGGNDGDGEVMLVTGESRQGPPSEVLLAMATARIVEQVVV